MRGDLTLHAVAEDGANVTVVNGLQKEGLVVKEAVAELLPAVKKSCDLSADAERNPAWRKLSFR